MRSPQLLKLANYVIFVVLGVFLLLFLTVYLTFTSPLFIYRWIITKIVVPCIGRNRGKAVTVNGNGVAAEFLQPEAPPRSNIVVNLIFDGNLSYEAVYEAVDHNWIKPVNDQGELKYPEFQQYIESWLGFMFWKPDRDFRLENHVKLHNIDENGNDLDSECFVSQLNEKLMNEPYGHKRSPWEMHLVQNYKNSTLLVEKGNKSCTGNMNLLAIRFHHGMADGYAILYLIVQQLAGYPLDKAFVATPTLVNEKHSSLRGLIESACFPLKILYEMGRVVALTMKRRTLYHISDSKKSGTQLCVRSPLIPVSKIKHIKNALGVSFAAVVNSSIAAGLAKMLTKLEQNSDCFKDAPRYLLFGNSVPGRNHPKKCRNKSLGVVFDIPITANMDAIERVLECEKNVQEVKNSPMAMLSGFLLQILSGTPAPLARYLLKNRFLGVVSSSMPGPGVELCWKGRKAIAVNCATGGLHGVAGVFFMTLSYAGNVQICVTAESAVLFRDDIHQLLKFVCDEIDILYELTSSSENIKFTCRLNIIK